MGNENQELEKKKKEQKPEISLQQQNYEKRQMQGWDALDKFDKTSGIVATKEGLKYNELNEKTLAELRDELFLDTYSKSESFTDMYEAVNKLLNLSMTKGRVFDETGDFMTVDFFETFFSARQAVARYLDTHEGFKFMGNSKRRYQIATRVQMLLNSLGASILETKSKLPTEKQAEIDGAQMGLNKDEIRVDKDVKEVNAIAKDMDTLLRYTEDGPAMDEMTAQKAREEWLKGGYTDKLKKALSENNKMTKEEKNELIAYLQNENNRLLADKVTVGLLVDANKKELLNITQLKKDLTKYIYDNSLKEWSKLQPKEYAEKVQGLIKQFMQENSTELKQLKKRKAMLETDPVLGASMTEEGIYDNPEMIRLMVYSDDNEFQERKAKLIEKVKENDAPIIEMLKERGYSALGFDAIKAKLDANMGALRLFGTDEQRMDQANIFCDMLRYIAPDEYQQEENLNKAMKYLKLEGVRKEAFVKYVMNQKQDANTVRDAEWWRKQGEEYSKRVKKNTKSYIKRVEAEGIMLSKERWDLLEEMNRSSGEWENADFKSAMERIIFQKNAQGEKRYSRREYISKRDFDDAEKTPGVIKRRKKEEAAIKKLGSSMDSRFLLALSFGGSNPDAINIQADDMMKGNAAKRKLAEKANAETEQQRIRNVQRMLQRSGIPRKEWDKSIEKLRWMISEIRDVSEEINSDKRAENMRINLETFGVKSWDEALQRLESMGSKLTDALANEEIEKHKKFYDKRMKALKTFEKGRYAGIADQLAKIPEFYAAMMDSDEKVFTDYLKNELTPKLKDFMEGAEKAKKAGNQCVTDPIIDNFSYSYLRNIYDGEIKGDAAYFQERIEGHCKRFFEQIDINKNGIKSNVRAAIREIEKKYKGKGLSKTALRSTMLSFEYNLKFSLTSREDLAAFLDKKKLLVLAEKVYTNAENENKTRKVKGDKERNDLIKQLKRKADLESASKDPDKELRQKIQDQREKGRNIRMDYLGYDSESLDKLRLGASLVRVKQNGRYTVTLTHGKVNTMRGEVEKYVGNIKIPQVLKDALIEEGASSSMDDRIGGIYDDDEMLYRHAAAMEKLYSLLRTESPDDGSMSDEEAQMYIVSLYGDMSKRELFDEKDKLDVASLRKEESYKVFRENYSRIKALEGKTFDELYVKNEQSEISRNLRAMLITGVGFKDENGKAVRFGKLKDDKKLEYQKKLGDMITKQTRFLEASQSLSDIIRAHVVVTYENDNINTAFIDRMVNALKEYFMEDLIKDLNEGKEVKAEDWNDKIFDFIKEKSNRMNLEGNSMTISRKEAAKREQERSDSKVGEKELEEVIKASTVFLKGKANKYSKLDIDQKKLFAIALMMMDKGAIGIGTAGTSALLTSKGAKKELTDEISKKIEDYVKGGTLDVKIDYKEAFFKLVNYGDAGLIGLTDSYVMSDTAYEKAMLFVKAITTKKQQIGEKDVKRISDGYSSIYAAYVNHDKKQQNEVDKLNGVTLTAEDVRDRLLQYAENDTVSMKRIAAETVIGTAGLATFAVGAYKENAAEVDAKLKTKEKGSTVRVDSKQKGKNAIVQLSGEAAGVAMIKAEEDITLNYNLSSVKKRLKEMDDTQLKMFLRLLQERSVIDVTTGEGKDKNVHVDQKKREALVNALSGSREIRSEVLDGFDSDDSCHQAMATALSFQLKDDVNFKGKPLTKEYFEKESFERTTLVDWKLIVNALDMLDEIQAKRNEIYAIQNAKKFIDVSGNQKAIDMHKELEHDFKNKKDKFNDFHFNRMISSKVDSEGDDSVKNAYAGFMKLSDTEKRLFYKVLARRDLLDISKKNYVSNFFGIDERGYLNEADRSKLIDQYIMSSLNDNIGLQLDDSAIYDAMESLLSTQISDRVDFKKEKNLDSIFAFERGLLFARGTAIDWKLFKRALNFVTRASKELAKTEGNAMLYRGAGDLMENGAMKMDYSFLRKNFHRTGNRWTRYLGRKAVNEVKDQLKLDNTLAIITGYVNTADNVTKSLGLKESGLGRQGVNKLKKITGEAGKVSKKLAENPSVVNISAVEIKEKEKTKEEKAKEEAKEAKRREDLLFYEHMKEGVDNIVAMKKSSQEAATEIAAFLKKNFATKFMNEKYLSVTGEKEAQADKDNLVEKATKGVKKDTTYGDIRDYKAKVESYQKKVKNYWGTVTAVPGMKEITELAQYGAKLLAYRFINDKLVNAEISDDKDELDQLTKAADKYFKKTFDNMVVSVVGEERAKSLIEMETSIYDLKKTIAKSAKSILGGIKYAKKCVAHIENIAASFENKEILEKNEKQAAGKQAEDKKKLEKAKSSRLDAHGAQLMEQQHKANKAEVALGKRFANTVQNFNIAEDVMNLVFETTNYAGLKLNIGQEVIQRAIKSGIEFAMYAVRVATDRNALTDYYLRTEVGKEEINKIKTGFLKAHQFDKVDMIDNALIHDKMNIRNKDTKGLVDIIADVNGYEHTSELMEDTAMQMAQSIVFCASSYNPMMESKIMATAVMVVMGLGAEVGNTAPDTVEKLFKSFKMPV